MLTSVSPTSALYGLNNLWAHTDKSLRNVASGKNLSLLSESPGAYAAAISYSSDAADRTAVQPGLSLASGSLNMGVSALSNVNNALQAMRGMAQNALSNPSPTVRADMQTQFNTLLGQVNNLVANAGVNGINLVSSSPSSVTLCTGAQGGGTLTVNGKASDATSLGLTQANWSSSSIQASIGAVDNAINTVQGTMAGFGAPMSAVNSTSDYNASTILANQATADTLTQDDLPQEVATLASLRTGQEASIAALKAYVGTQRATLALLK